MLIVQHPVPSLNRLFAMTQWQRHREKKDTLAALLSALHPSAEGSSTLTTSSVDRSILRTAYATLASYVEIQKLKSALKSASKKSQAKPPSARALKSNRSTDRSTNP